MLAGRHEAIEGMLQADQGGPPRPTMDLTRVDQAENGGVLQVGDGLDLAEKPLGPDHGGQLGAEHLDGDLAVVLRSWARWTVAMRPAPSPRSMR